MFFFFVGGLEQQVRQVLKSGSGRCIFCGSKADLVDYEKVLKLFFVPVWRWPGKHPLMHCDNCSAFFPAQSLPSSSSSVSSLPDLFPRCPSCSRKVDSEFRFCPFCGYQL